MTDIEQLKEQLKKQEKLASLGLLSAGIAHEIQNPLNFVINFSKMSERLLKDLTDLVADNEDKLSAADREEIDDIVSDLQDNMAKIVEHGERAIGIIQSILLVSRGKENEFRPADICQIVRDYVRLSYHAMRANSPDFNVTIREDYPAGLPPVKVIPQDLSRAVLNLMNNAFYAVWQRTQTAESDYKPEVSVSVAMEDSHPSTLNSKPSARCSATLDPSRTLNSQPSTLNPSLTITISDNGVGMTDEVKQHLYENFFTTKPIGQGTGLGMSIVRDIIENKHHGTITFDSQPGEGTTFTLTIPAHHS